MPYLTKDINSLCHPSYCYGKASDEVSIVSNEHGDVLIVKNKEGSTFPAHKNKISNTPIENSQVAQTETIIQTVAEKKTRKPATSLTSQQSIF